MIKMSQVWNYPLKCVGKSGKRNSKKQIDSSRVVNRRFSFRNKYPNESSCSLQRKPPHPLILNEFRSVSTFGNDFFLLQLPTRGEAMLLTCSGFHGDPSDMKVLEAQISFFFSISLWMRNIFN